MFLRQSYISCGELGKNSSYIQVKMVSGALIVQSLQFLELIYLIPTLCLMKSSKSETATVWTGQYMRIQHTHTHTHTHFLMMLQIVSVSLYPQSFRQFLLLFWNFCFGIHNSKHTHTYTHTHTHTHIKILIIIENAVEWWTHHSIALLDNVKYICICFF
jgi:hypothetical protein